MARKSKTFIEEPTKPIEMTAMPESIETEVTDSHDSYLRSRCGGALRQAREAQTLSVQDVASKLRLSPKQIEAIEADQFAKLPEPTIVRGFIRNYAKLLKINAEPLLDAYTVIVPSNSPHELTIKPTSNMHVSSVDKPKPSTYLWAGLSAALALGVWLFYQNYVEKPSPTKTSANVELVEPLPEPALPAAERAPEEVPALQPSVELTLPPANADATALPAPATELAVPAPSNAVAVDMPAPANALPASSLPVAPAPITALPIAQPESAPAPADMAKIEFNATQETWVSVVDADGKQVYDKIIFAGSRESVEAKPPLTVVVGNAGATSISFNGKSVALAPHSRNNVARIKLE